MEERNKSVEQECKCSFTNKNSEDDKIDPRYEKVLETLHSHRDMEINNLWQRSIFLATLLVLCYTAYGTVFMRLLDCNCESEKSIQVWQIHLVLVCVALIGVFFSTLWIMMAKASKAWQEAHENAITDLEFFTMYNNLPYHGQWGNWTVQTQDVYGWWHGGYLWLKKEKVSNCIFSHKAGCYSPSKINITIGIVSFIIFITAVLFHLIYVWRNMSSETIESSFNWIDLILFFIAIVAIIICLCSTKSGALRKKIFTKCTQNDTKPNQK